MFKKLYTLFKIGRTLALSEALEIIYKVHQPPILVKTLFKILSVSFRSEKKKR